MARLKKRRSAIFSYSTIKHKKIILEESNYTQHIKNRHPEMTLEIIEYVFADPDYIYKEAVNSKKYYYEREIEDINYRVVVDKYGYSTKKVVTAYRTNDEHKEFYKKHNYCCYNKENNNISEKLENERNNLL